MLDALIRRYNVMRRKNLFASPAFNAKKVYAFVGAGMHSVTNLYPVLHHFGINLKYISTKQSNAAESLQRFFPNASFVHGIDQIVIDETVDAVFVSAGAAEHFELVKRLISAHKEVFVEKPPCTTLSQLHELIGTGAVVFCGLQRRFWPANKILRKRLTETQNYTYQFYTGPLFGGDVFTELFIHPIDYCQFLFGPLNISSYSHKSFNGQVTVQLHGKHASGVSALIDLSTAHDWNNPIDRLSIMTRKELITATYPVSISSNIHPKRLLGLPTERVLQQPSITKTIFFVRKFSCSRARGKHIGARGFL